MSDRITLTGLRVFGCHGVFEHEKRDGQEFVVDITVWLDSPAAHERIWLPLNFSAVSNHR